MKKTLNIKVACLGDVTNDNLVSAVNLFLKKFIENSDPGKTSEKLTYGKGNLPITVTIESKWEYILA